MREWGIEVLNEEIKKQEQEKEIPTFVKKRSMVGDPINFEGLIYGPLNENGVIFLFSKIHDKVGINIEAIQAAYPDAKARRKSANFKLHKHDPRECDIIVCWEHDWEDCPIGAIELKTVIKEIKGYKN